MDFQDRDTKNANEEIISMKNVVGIAK